MLDVSTVLKNLPVSASGPDGVPFAAWGSISDILAPIVLDTVLGMIAGREVPYDKFNEAFFVCLPKVESEILEPGSTRPLSVVDSINRILASVFRISLERAGGKQISEFRRGFLQGRSMLRNILELDHNPQKISIKHKSGAILLLGFKAAFACLSHDFLWDVLISVGVPEDYVGALNHFTWKTNIT